MLFTDNKTTTITTEIAASEIISSLSLATWAGQASPPVSFRIASEDEYGETVILTCPEPAIALSLNPRRGYSNSVTLEVDAGAVSDSVFVTATASLDVGEADNQALIFLSNGSSLLVNYSFAAADTGDTDLPPVTKYMGQETLNMAEQFDLYAETVRLTRYEPLPNPLELPDNPFPLSAIANLSPEEKCNPFNQTVGYTAEPFYSKGFIGDHSLDANTIFDAKDDTELVFSDSERVLLPPDFPGFDPSHLTGEEFYGNIGPSQPAYQRTQWTLSRHDGEYSLMNIRQQKYFNGQFLFYVADIERVVYPQGYAKGFLPWNQLYQSQSDGGQVIGYVAGYSQVVTEDPYLEGQSDV